MNLRLAALLAIFLVASGSAYIILSSRSKSQVDFSDPIANISQAAAKAGAIQTKELDDVFDALKRGDSRSIVFGDRFLRWTVLAFTLWKIDQGDLSIIEKMKQLLEVYYARAWYPNVKNAPDMPFPSLIQFFRADGTWEDYWNDYKPVYVAAFVHEFHVIASFDRSWATANYYMMKNAADSLLRMWLPARHQPTAYVDATKGSGFQLVEIKNIISSVDNAMVYSALIAASRVAQVIANDVESARVYTEYARDLHDSFASQRWDWFPTRILGSNPSEAYGTTVQLGMTVPHLDADEKVDELKDYVEQNLRISSDSWLLKWRKEDTVPSARSVVAAVGLAPKYADIAIKILDAYAREAIAKDPWFLSKTDGYEAEDPIWVSGKFLQTYVMVKTRILAGTTALSPGFILGQMEFRTSLPAQPRGIPNLDASLPSLTGLIVFKAKVDGSRLRLEITGGQLAEFTIRFIQQPELKLLCSQATCRKSPVQSSDSVFSVIAPNGVALIEVQK